MDDDRLDDTADDDWADDDWTDPTLTSAGRKRDRLARLLKVASILYSSGGTDQGVPVAEIARLTQMNKRTVYRDLRALDDELAMPIFQAGRGRYGIERRYFLPPLDLTVPEAIALFLAARLIARWSDESDQVVVSAFIKIASALPQPIARHVNATMLAVGEQRTNEPFTAIFATVARGWAEGRVLEIIYDWGGEVRTTRVRPYLLEPLATGRSIYLIGHDETAGAMRTYKVERIRQAILTVDKYEIPEDFNPARYLAYSWGIWSSDQAPPVTVRLRFDPAVTDRVKETVWHRTQQLSDRKDGGVDLTVQVAGIVEIRPWIMSWGDQVEVLEPPELREVVATAARGLAARYG
ncbi:MAG TPA: WYL domain-containing protein [Candidatus Limnocylindria bacterium]|jgi:proteasome accessory factor B